MNGTILHETKGRIRVHIKTARMTLEQADKLEYYLRQVSGVDNAHVSERTCNATILFAPEKRGAVVRAIAEYDQETTEVAVPDHNGRAIKREFQDKLFRHLVRDLFRRIVLPAPIRRISVLVRSIPYFVHGLRCLAEGRLAVPVLDMVSIAVSLLQGDFKTAGNIMFLLKLGDIIEEWTHKKTVADLAEAMALGVDKVWVRTGEGVEVLTRVTDVQEGELIVVRAGNQIPLDGDVVSGEATVNQASMTGESEPVHKSENSSVYAGTVLEEGELLVRVRSEAGEGRYDRIVRMIEDSEKLKSSAETKASHLADRLVPYTFGATLLTLLLTRNVTRATSILMVDFCCALKLSMPIAVLSAMREAGDQHMSVKGGKFLEAVAEAQTIVFDKTGTLTHANPKVAGVVTFGGYDEDEALRLAACLEEHFPHSMANAVVKEAEERGLIHEEEHAEVEYIVAHGIVSSLEGKRVLIGSHHFVFEDEKCTIPRGEKRKFNALPSEYSHLYLASGGKLIAAILIEDPIREDAAQTIRKLRQEGFDKIVMMTGDSDRTAKAVAEKVGVDLYFSEVLPEDKANFIHREHALGRTVIMVGDGVNDSPALSAADVGIAISEGAAIAREIADITVESESLESLILLRQLARKLMARIRSNYRKILSFNTGLIVLGALGVLQPTMTALLHNGSTIVISLESMKNLLEKAPDEELRREAIAGVLEEGEKNDEVA